MDTVIYPDEIRHKIRSGDIILWKGNGFISRLIRLFTPYSHASLVVKLDRYKGLRDRVFLIEALATGLEPRLLSKRLKNYDGEAYLLQPLDLNPEISEKITILALEKCAEHITYDFKSLIKNILGRVSLSARQFFCSEWVWWVRVQVGLADGTTKAPRPGDLPKWIPGKMYKLEYKGD